jgi:Fe-S cluster assembly ATP-binding protein
MGPNGAGKSTLLQFLAGRPGYTHQSGEVHFQGQNLLDKPAEERARAGMLLAFQYPVELPGVNNAHFLKSAVNARRAAMGKSPYDAVDFLTCVKAEMAHLDMPTTFLERATNVDFSGGEKKRNEILQLLMMEPELALLDEIDSGLDIDALKHVARGIQRLRERGCAIILVTHYSRMLDYVAPDYVHVLLDGKIAVSGDLSVVQALEAQGYGLWRAEVAVG